MRYLVPCFCLLLLAACSQSPQRFRFDNPGTQALAMQVDGKPQTIPAHAELVIDLAPGAHTLETSQLGRVPFVVYAGHDGALVNPTLSDYVLVDEVYWTDAARPVEFAGTDKVQVQGVEVTGRFGLTHALFIDKDWDFDVHVPFPETASAPAVDASGGRRMRKIFAPDDFVAYYEATHDAPGYFAAHRPADWQAPVRSASSEAPRLPALAPIYEPHATAMRKLVDDYLHATDPAEQQRLRKAYVPTQIAFTHATASLGPDLPVIEHTRMNDFVTGVSRVMNSAALVTPR
ncbi:hypothetical protein [Pseudoxanthomonas sp.]|uniref:hypothetical protein n=1 Tax=Pseudoxanthomonas sp. TaxID=1871049 RepID=UPI002634546D|nr:hypothetical protein [Pseudoxanthomonas sp.]WDS37271.1 MAG: hypothetical protein O8I58_05120 [Pseudoxanthomonas sp.]